jgi:hypothetical protein
MQGNGALTGLPGAVCMKYRLSAKTDFPLDENCPGLVKARPHSLQSASKYCVYSAAFYGSRVNEKILNETARAMVAPGRGILAADESTGTIKKRFDKIGVDNVEANRQAYRDMLFNTPDFEKHTSGVILFEETLFQKSLSGVPFPELLASKGVLPGIKGRPGRQAAVRRRRGRNHHRRP